MGTPKGKVLVCDDDMDFTDSIRGILEKEGYEVAVASDGDDCIEKANSDRPDLILLDVMMRTMSEGFNVSRELRNSERTKSIPIIMITSIHEKVSYKFGPDETWLPVDVFLEKPVDPRRLLEEIAKKIGSRPGGKKA